MGRVCMEVQCIEFDTEGNTIWVQAEGGTVLRIKTLGKITTEMCESNPVSHSDLIVEQDIHICLAAGTYEESTDAEEEDPELPPAEAVHEGASPADPQPG